MKWLGGLALIALTACSGTRALQASKNLPYATLEQTVQPGASKQQVRTVLGDSTAIRFDSGNEVWMYNYPSPSGAQAEFVILFGADGLVKQVRSAEVYQLKQ